MIDYVPGFCHEKSVESALKQCSFEQTAGSAGLLCFRQFVSIAIVLHDEL
jgi:hypothetical protein